ncbi:MAG: DUF1360 domain-containing protein [Caulobacteraceae bacterium]|nr:DUF1360 domain-containing protein [Caulobacteraceae bacterium]
MTLDLVTFIIYALAAFRLTRVITTDTIFEPVRERIWKKFPASHGFGYLITCDWCTGFYVSILFVVGFLLVPVIAYVVSLVLSISAVIGLLAGR